MTEPVDVVRELIKILRENHYSENLSCCKNKDDHAVHVAMIIMKRFTKEGR